MNKKIVVTALALVMTLAVAGGALAAVPNAMGGQGFGIGHAMGGLVTRVANFLEWEVEAVREARVDGSTLAEILGEDNVDAFIAAAVAERQAILEGMLADGKITQAQYEQCGNFTTERLEERLNAVVMGGQGRGMHSRGNLQRRGK